jgi:hypothetical protein
VIEKNQSRLDKAMESAKEQVHEVGDIVALQFASPDDEADYIARTCKALRGTMIKEDGGERSISWSDMAVLVRYTKFGEPIRRAFAREGIPFVSLGMDTLFDAPEGEAARQLFYFMANRASRDDVLKAWRAAKLGIPDATLVAAVKEAEATRAKMAAEDQDVRFSVYNIQRQFIGFLERIGLREELVPNGRGPLVFYNLGKFSQAISDFETIYFHSRPESLFPNLDAAFLQAQPDEWIVRLYEFLNKVPAVVERLDDVPLVRLEDGTHVAPFIMGHPQAFLPTHTATEFPTVRRSVCAPPQAKKFLQSLKLTEPDPVDDVIRNLLPKYQSRRIRAEDYAADIARILHAFKTDSTAQKDKLISSLKISQFVMAKEMDDGSISFQWPDHLYLATARMKELFEGIPGIYVVDDSQDCLRGEDIRELLEACGAPRYIYPVQSNSTLSDDEKFELRRARGVVNATWERPVEDFGLRGLPALLKQLPTLSRTRVLRRLGYFGRRSLNSKTDVAKACSAEFIAGSTSHGGAQPSTPCLFGN